MADLNPQDVSNAISQVLDSFKGSTPAAGFSLFGCLLLLTTVLLAKLWPRTKLTRALLALVLLASVFCLFIGPGLALYEARRPFEIVTRSQAFLNLEGNQYVNWLVRFIVFDPTSQDKVQQALALARFQTLQYLRYTLRLSRVIRNCVIGR